MNSNSKNKKHILIIAFNFPPNGSIGARRPYYFAKFLAKNGNQVSVVTGSLDQNKKDEWNTSLSFCTVYRFPVRNMLSTYNLFQKRLLSIYLQIENIPIINKICRTLLFFLLPNDFNNRIDVNINDLKNKISNLDFVWATGGPWHVFDIANKINTLYNSKLVLDYRDPWTTKDKAVGVSRLSYYGDGIVGKMKYRFVQKREKTLLKQADIVCSVSKPLIENLKLIYPSTSKYHIIANGFDKDKYDSVINNKKELDFFQIIYVGSLYEEQVHMAKIFINAFRCFANNNSKVRLLFIGNLSKYPAIFLKEIRENTSEIKIKLIEHQPKDVLKELISQSSICLNFEYDGRSGVFPVKVFEYFEEKKRIFIISSNNDMMASAIKKTGTGVVLNSFEDIKFELERSFKEWKSKGACFLDPNIEELKKYSFDEQLFKFLSIINK